ncbi:MAG: hypothetical protein GX367_02825 [Bacteroidales bacterium]|nr:hypothetical protein [Bacteroidales bacterium]
MKNIKNQRGSATIEATISLTCFIFVIMSIYTLVNFCIVQAKMAYAINTTAKEMSQFSYFYNAFGLEKADQSMRDKQGTALDTFQNINKLISDAGAQAEIAQSNPGAYLNDLIEEYSKTGQSQSVNLVLADFEKAKGNISDALNNPSEFLKSMAALGGVKASDNLKKLVAASVAQGMTRRHFGKDAKSANEYLERMGVVGGYEGVNFNKSTMFDTTSPKDIKIVVVYNMNLATIFPFDLNVTISQSAVCRGWLGGDL